MQSNTAYKSPETEQTISDKDKLLLVSSAIANLLLSIDAGMKMNISLIKLDIVYKGVGSNTNYIKVDFS